MAGWITAFIDGTSEAWDRSLDFWTAATGCGLSPFRGEHAEFVTLVPPSGSPYLKLQRLREGEPRIHLDLHAADRHAQVDEAVRLGAREVSVGARHVVMESPGGFTLCVVDLPDRSRRPPAARWVDGAGHEHASQLDQVAIDVPAEHWDREVAFWSALTGWEAATPHPDAPEFSALDRPDGQPLRLLMHRLGEPTGVVRAHLDLACSDRDAETARHLGLGAVVERVRDDWTVMTAPDGSRYCLTDRAPSTP